MSNNKTKIIIAVITATGYVAAAAFGILAAVFNSDAREANQIIINIERELQEAQQAPPNADDRQFDGYRDRIAELESEIAVFVARGEPPVPRTPEGQVASITSLGMMTNIGDRLHSTTVNQDNYGEIYTGEVVYLNPWGESSFQTLLNSQYTRLRGTVFVRYGYTGHGERGVQFELDGRVVGSHTMDRTSRPVSIDIDLTGANEFRIILSRSSAFRLYFADFNFYP